MRRAGDLKLLGRWKFRPSLVPTIVTVLLLPGLVGLGFWQLGRAQYKRELQTLYDQRSQEPPVAIDAGVSGEALQFHRVVASGTYVEAYEILLDNRVHDGRVGYHVLTPLKVSGSNLAVLVNRGWVPLAGDRATQPVTPPPPGVVQISGVATLPHERVFALGPPVQAAPGWPRLWQYIDIERYRGRVPFAVAPVVILLDPQSPGGYVREWARLDMGIATHQGYAFQWFMLALALIAIYFLVNLKPVGAEHER